MDHNLFNFSTPEGQESIITTMLTPIDATREDIQRSLEARASALELGAEEHPRQVVIFREVRNMTDQVADEFSERLKALLEEFENYEAEEANEDTHSRALTVAFYPSFYYKSQENGK